MHENLSICDAICPNDRHKYQYLNLIIQIIRNNWRHFNPPFPSLLIFSNFSFIPGQIISDLRYNFVFHAVAMQVMKLLRKAGYRPTYSKNSPHQDHIFVLGIREGKRKIHIAFRSSYYVVQLLERGNRESVEINFTPVRIKLEKHYSIYAAELVTFTGTLDITKTAAYSDVSRSVCFSNYYTHHRVCE